MSLRNPLVAVYPGTFDPMTLGHEDLMRRASRLFERLILEINQAGLSWLTILKRQDGFRAAFRAFEIAKVARVKIVIGGGIGRTRHIDHLVDAEVRLVGEDTDDLRGDIVE